MTMSPQPNQATHTDSTAGWRSRQMPRRRLMSWLAIGGNGLLLVLWCWLFRPLYPYLTLILTGQFFRTTQLIFLLLAALVFYQIKQGTLRLALFQPPRLAHLPLAMSIGSALCYVVAARLLDMNIVASTLFFSGSYGLLGLWIDGHRWRQGLPVALLLVAALPFGEHVQTFIGYPMRIATAHLVGSGFQQMGIGTIGLDTILTFENGIAHVDLPCSGVKSLWTGGIFLIAATWIERHPLNVRWLLIALLLGLLLFLGNFLRVAILIGVGVVGQLTLLAELLHVPLGVLSFGIACGMTLWLVRRNRTTTEPMQVHATSTSLVEVRPVIVRPLWLVPLLSLTLLALTALYQPRPANGLQAASPTWAFPADITIINEPLTEEETWWLTKDGADSAARMRFQWQGRSGSMLLISSHTWRAHHRPERCFEVKGLMVNDLRTHLVSNDLPIRAVTLGEDGNDDSYSAVYWFQSADQITDEYATRMWADLTLDPKPWVLVSLLFDDHQAPDDPTLTPLYQAIAATVESEIKR